MRRIASGGMAEIFLARAWGEASFFRDVVVKRLFENLAAHEDTVRSFQFEARILAHLSHPNVPQVYDLGFEQGTWFLAMEHVEGATLADVWRRGARLGQGMPLEVTLGVLHQVAEALAHVHAACDREGRPLRIVHRDVTPHNVMLRHDGVAKLLDFGVAKSVARAETGATRGTHGYMAPEQARGGRVDQRADVFALGIVLYELTTGRRLFRGPDAAVLVEVVERDVAPPSVLAPGYPAELEAIVLGALARDPAKRTPNAAELAGALEAFASKHGLRIGRRSLAERLRPLMAPDVGREGEGEGPEAEAPAVAPEHALVLPADAAELGLDDELPTDESLILDAEEAAALRVDPLEDVVTEVNLAVTAREDDTARLGHERHDD
ncbi:MAG: serine/threonine-protein kinase [Myxococcota bacterium]